MISTKTEWGEEQNIPWDEYFDLRFKEAIKTTKKFIQKLGAEQVYEILDELSYSEGVKDGKAVVMNKKSLTSLSDFSKVFKEAFLNDPLFKTALDVEIIEDSQRSFRLKVKKCLWAYTFNENEAADIGYHMICNGDYGIAEGISPNLKLVRPQTLMRRKTFCDFQYTWEDS